MNINLHGMFWPDTSRQHSMSFSNCFFLMDICITICYSDSYVHKKLGDSAWIPAKDRCRLCEDAIEHEGSEVSSWISVSRGESEWDDGFVDFGPVTENLRDFLNTTLVDQGDILQHPLRVVYVCGLDHFNKCSNVESMAKQRNMACAIVYRAGYDEQQITRSVQKSGAIYIPLSKERTKLADVSSTQIRQYFENSSARNTNVERNIYPAVSEYMSRKYNKKK
jgi:nicotinic acid mononucleotide adenylyltransferase